MSLIKEWSESTRGNGRRWREAIERFVPKAPKNWGRTKKMYSFDASNTMFNGGWIYLLPLVIRFMGGFTTALFVVKIKGEDETVEA